MKQIVLVLLTLSLVAGGILWFVNSAKKQTVGVPTNNTNNSLGSTNKTGTTTKTGMITQTAGRYFLQETGGSLMEIESYSVELGAYVGKTVTVSGQYSGDTLFVGEVK